MLTFKKSTPRICIHLKCAFLCTWLWFPINSTHCFISKIISVFQITTITAIIYWVLTMARHCANHFSFHLLNPYITPASWFPLNEQRRKEKLSNGAKSIQLEYQPWTVWPQKGSSDFPSWFCPPCLCGVLIWAKGSTSPERAGLFSYYLQHRFLTLTACWNKQCASKKNH